MYRMHQFKYADMEFSKDGQLDELIALDRYAIPTYDNYEVGDTVVAIVDKEIGNKKVGEIVGFENEDYRIKDRLGEIHQIQKELMHKPLELKPVQMWERWAKGAASVEETFELQQEWESKFRKLVDGYGYSLGGRIQLMLGQEYVTGEKANLTSYNCFVTESAQSKETPFEQFKEVLRIAYKEASIMRRGGGVGMNISHIETVKGSGRDKDSFKFVLPSSHADFNELQDRKLLDKFNPIEVVESYPTSASEDSVINVGDSIDELFNALNEMVEKAYNSKSNIIVDFTQLRHRNAIVRGVNGRSSGSVSWMELFTLVAELLQFKQIDNIDFAEIFSHITHLIEQGGSRRGALMIVNNVDNKNIRKFIERKKNPKYLTGANISVGISDSFMSKVKTNNKKANETWSLLIGSAWTSAEPGILFLERMNKESNSQYYNIMEATNPCKHNCMAYQ